MSISIVLPEPGEGGREGGKEGGREGGSGRKRERKGKGKIERAKRNQNKINSHLPTDPCI